jgi:hypothetical protein
MRYAFYLDFTQCKIVASYQRFGTNLSVPFKGSRDLLDPWNGTEILSRNFCKELLLYFYVKSQKSADLIKQLRLNFWQQYCTLLADFIRFCKYLDGNVKNIYLCKGKFYKNLSRNVRHENIVKKIQFFMVFNVLEISKQTNKKYTNTCVRWWCGNNE